MVRRVAVRWFCTLSALGASSLALADTREVGPGKAYPAPCAAFQAANDGDLITIDAAGSYAGDVCAIGKNNLTIRGVGGRPHIDAHGMNAQGKAIWVVQGHDTIIDNVELSGCTVPDNNGAGIRQEGVNLTVTNSYFHDNQDGILTNADHTSTIQIIDSEFANNGAGDGQSHNMYIGEVGSFTLRGCYSHDANVGHLVKSRALKNFITYNRLSDEGPSSYELDLPQGGESYVIGNVLAKSMQAQNSAFISYARESTRNANSALWVVSNTFYNTRSTSTFVAVAQDVTSVTLRDNIFSGPGTPCDLMAAVSDTNFVGDPMFVSANQFDFHLMVGSPAVDHGVTPGSADMQSLVPACQYVHPAHAVKRMTVGNLDQGAFEYGGETATDCETSGTSPSGMLDGGVDAGRPPPVVSTPITPAYGADAAVNAGDAGTRPIDPSGPAPTEIHKADSGGCRASPSVNGSILSSLLSLLLAVAMMRKKRH